MINRQYKESLHKAYRLFDLKKYDEAFTLLEPMANDNVEETQSALAELYSTKKFSKFDLKKSIFWYKKAIDNGSQIATYYLARLYHTTKSIQNLSKAKKLYLLQSRKDINCFSKTGLYLGEIYEKGKNPSVDLEKAFYWYSQSANKGEDKAQYNLAHLYQNKKFHLYNLEKSFFWFEKSATRGNIKAQYHFIKFCAFSNRYPNDIKSFFPLLKKSKTSSINKKHLYKFYKKLSKKGNGLAYYLLGHFCKSSINTNDSDYKAIKYFKKAAKRGYVDALYYIGWIYRNTTTDELLDSKKAHLYFLKAAKKGHSKAQFRVGMHFKLSPNKNYTKAIKWLKKSSNQNHIIAKKMLASIYLDELRTKENSKKSI